MACTFIFIVVLLAVFSPVNGQSADGLPNCAVICILDALPQTDCDSTDFTCVCRDVAQIETSVENCARKSCGADDFGSLPETIMKFCDATGVYISIAHNFSSSTPAPSSNIGTITSSMFPTSTSAGTVSHITPASATTPVPTSNAARANAIGILDVLAVIMVMYFYI